MHAQIAREDVLHGLLEAIEAARAKGDPGAQIAGWREVGRMCGFYAPQKLEVNVSDSSTRLRVDLEALSDAELFKLTQSAAEVPG